MGSAAREYAATWSSSGLSRAIPKSVEDLAHLAPPELPVLLAERIDRGMDDEHRHPHSLRELGHGVDDDVVALEIPAHEVPRPSPGVGQIGVAAPGPSAMPRPMADQRQGRQVMDHHEVGLQPERCRVGGGGLHVGDEHGLRDRRRLAGQRRLDRSRRAVERRVPDDDLPRGVDAQVLQQRHETRQHLRRPAAVAARVDVDEAPALEPLGELQQQIDRAARRDVPVLLQARSGHRAVPAVSASSRSAMSRARACSRLPP